MSGIIPTSPPEVKNPYKQDDALDDMAAMRYTLDTFLKGEMLQAEDYCHQQGRSEERLYFAVGFGLIQCFKGLMSYEDEDILAGIGHCKRGNQVSQEHRKPSVGVTSRLASFVMRSIITSGPQWYKSMTPVQLHAELIYAESLFEKALLGIVYSGDWLAFIREALNMRTIINTYRGLYKYIEECDAAYPPGQQDPSLDDDFRSGVYLGMGGATLILSLIPGRLLKVVELFGFKLGTRDDALRILMKPGGWEDVTVRPIGEGGVRRTICDLGLLIFHLVLSTFTFHGIDIPLAARILEFYAGTKANPGRYADGPFFLAGAGRLAWLRSQPEDCIAFNRKAMAVQDQYKSLHYLSWWEIAISSLSTWDLVSSEAAWRELRAGATWSPSIYAYGLACCILQDEANLTEERRKEAADLLADVADLRKRIAGKSIPLEKFVARKSRRKTRVLPALEIAYTFGGLNHSPKSVLQSQVLPQFQPVFDRLSLELKSGRSQDNGNSDFGMSTGGMEVDDWRTAYWDEWCLVAFLKGVTLRYMAFPDKDAVDTHGEDVRVDGENGQLKVDIEGGEKEVEKVKEEAEEALKDVIEHGRKIELDHHLVYFAHYELGRLYACMGKIKDARHHLELVVSGRPLEVSGAARKGRYSLENSLVMKAHAGVEALDARAAKEGTCVRL